MKRMSWIMALLVVACGGAPIPHERLGAAEAEIRAAQVVADDLRAQGPNEQLPQADLHLKMAKDQVAQAKLLIEDKQNEEAARVLERAEADADYALALAKEANAKTEVGRVRAEVDALRKKAQSAQ